MKKLVSFLLASVLLADAGLAPAAETGFWAERAARPPVADGAWGPAASARLSSLRLDGGSRSGLLPARRAGDPLADLAAAVPPSAATVRAAGGSSGAGAPVVLIEDVHLNADAQTNIAAVLASLLRSGRVGLVGAEGAFSRFPVERVRSLPDKAATRSAARAFLDANVMSAPSFVAATTDTAVPFTGVDDPALHAANVRAYLDARPAQPALQAALAGLERSARERKAAAWGPALAAWDALHADRDRGALGTAAFVERLAALADRAAPEVARGRPASLSAFLAAAALERRLDFAQAERERRDVLALLVGRLSPAESASLLSDAAALRLGRVSFGDFYGRVAGLCARKGVDLSRRPSFAAYLRYVSLSDAVDGARLLSDVDSFDRQLGDALAKTPGERALLRATENLSSLRRLAGFELTPEDWARLKTRRDPLGAVASAIGAAVPAVDLAPFENFYRFADRRSAALVDRLLSAPAPAGARVLVLGGFHTSEVARRLAAAGRRCLIVTPCVTRGGSASDYLSVFAEKATPLDRLFGANALFVCPSTVHLTNAAVERGLAAASAATALASAPVGTRTAGTRVAAEKVAAERVRVDLTEARGTLERDADLGVVETPLERQLGFSFSARGDRWRRAWTGLRARAAAARDVAVLFVADHYESGFAWLESPVVVTPLAFAAAGLGGAALAVGFSAYGGLDAKPALFLGFAVALALIEPLLYRVWLGAHPPRLRDAATMRMTARLMHASGLATYGLFGGMALASPAFAGLSLPGFSLWLISGFASGHGLAHALTNGSAAPGAAWSMAPADVLAVVLRLNRGAGHVRELAFSRYYNADDASRAAIEAGLSPAARTWVDGELPALMETDIAWSLRTFLNGIGVSLADFDGYVASQTNPASASSVTGVSSTVQAIIDRVTRSNPSLVDLGRIREMLKALYETQRTALLAAGQSVEVTVDPGRPFWIGAGQYWYRVAPEGDRYTRRFVVEAFRHPGAPSRENEITVNDRAMSVGAAGGGATIASSDPSLAPIHFSAESEFEEGRLVVKVTGQGGLSIVAWPGVQRTDEVAPGESLRLLRVRDAALDIGQDHSYLAMRIDDRQYGALEIPRSGQGNIRVLPFADGDVVRIGSAQTMTPNEPGLEPRHADLRLDSVRDNAVLSIRNRSKQIFRVSWWDDGSLRPARQFQADLAVRYRLLQERLAAAATRARGTFRQARTRPPAHLSHLEDTALVDTDLGFVLVADGMGGMVGSETAAQIAVMAAHDFLRVQFGQRQTWTNDEIEELIERAAEAAESEVRRAQVRFPLLNDMGTTLSIGIVRNGRAFVGRVGDGTAGIRTKNGHVTVFGLSEGSKGEYLLLQGKIDAATARANKYQNVLAMFIGGARFNGHLLRESEVAATGGLPMITSAPLGPGDALWVATDGVDKNVHDFEAVAPTAAAGEWIDALVREAALGRSLDDITGAVLENTATAGPHVGGTASTLPVVYRAVGWALGRLTHGRMPEAERRRVAESVSPLLEWPLTMAVWVTSIAGAIPGAPAWLASWFVDLHGDQSAGEAAARRDQQAVRNALTTAAFLASLAFFGADGWAGGSVWIAALKPALLIASGANALAHLAVQRWQRARATVAPDEDDRPAPVDDAKLDAIERDLLTVASALARHPTATVDELETLLTPALSEGVRGVEPANGAARAPLALAGLNEAETDALVSRLERRLSSDVRAGRRGATEVAALLAGLSLVGVPVETSRVFEGVHVAALVETDGDMDNALSLLPSLSPGYRLFLLVSDDRRAATERRLSAAGVGAAIREGRLSVLSADLGRVESIDRSLNGVLERLGVRTPWDKARYRDLVVAVSPAIVARFGDWPAGSLLAGLRVFVLRRVLGELAAAETNAPDLRHIGRLAALIARAA